jgi:hypothetical protein
MLIPVRKKKHGRLQNWKTNEMDDIYAPVEHLFPSVTFYKYMSKSKILLI